MITVYHAKYFAHDLTRRCASDSVEKLAALSDTLAKEANTFLAELRNSK